MVEIVFVVLMIMLLVMQPYPGSPLAGWPLAGGIINFLLFLCLGIAVFGFGSGGGTHLGLR